MHRPKIIIQRKIDFGQGNFRYYSPNSKRRVKGEQFVYSLDPNDTRYPLLIIKTEKQLVHFVYNSFGIGEYRIIAIIRGRRGLWTFWKGVIRNDGWIHNERAHTKETTLLDDIEKEIKKSKSYEEKEDLEDEYKIIADLMNEDNNKEINRIKKKKHYVRYGFSPFLISSGRRGSFHTWDESDEAMIPHNPVIHNKKRDINEMTLDEINRLQ